MTPGLGWRPWATSESLHGLWPLLDHCHPHMYHDTLVLDGDSRQPVRPSTPCLFPPPPSSSKLYLQTPDKEDLGTYSVSVTDTEGVSSSFVLNEAGKAGWDLGVGSAGLWGLQSPGWLEHGQPPTEKALLCPQCSQLSVLGFLPSPAGTSKSRT